MADRHYSYGSYLYYHVGDYRNLTRLFMYLYCYSHVLQLFVQLSNEMFFWRIRVIWKVNLRIDSETVPFRIGLSLHHYVFPQSRSTSKLWAIATKRLRYTPLGNISFLAWVCKTFNHRLCRDSFFLCLSLVNYYVPIKILNLATQ